MIKNYQQLVTPKRKLILDLIKIGLEAIQPQKIEENVISIISKYIKNYKRVFLLGIGKGSSKLSKKIEEIFIDFLTDGWVIDINRENFQKIKFTLGTHPLPSEINFNFTQNLINEIQALNLNSQDLFIVIIYGGGSAFLVYPAKIDLNKKIEIYQELLKRNADIYQMNVVRKHLSLVKGGGLAKFLYPAKVLGLIASDVPGDDLSTIASGPIVMDKTTIEDAWRILEELNLTKDLKLTKNILIETPKDEKFFKNVETFLILTNRLALEAMKNLALSYQYQCSILASSLSGNVEMIAEEFFNLAKGLQAREIILAGGETTVQVVGNGIGGRNQELCLRFLKKIKDQPLLKDIVFAAVNSDGWDNTPFAGAIVDELTIKKIKDKQLDLDAYLANNDSYSFFKLINDGIETGRLDTNVSDLYILGKII